MMKSTFFFSLFIFVLFGHVYAQNYNLLIGTYTNKGTSEGIYTYNFNSLTGDAKLKSVAKGVVNPSYLAISKDQKFVYSVNEDGKNSGVSAFGFNAKKGELTFLNKISSAGADPCYLITNDKQVMVANYSGGSAAVFAKKADGSLGLLLDSVQHIGKSIDPKRQSSAHVHQIQFTPDQKYVVVNDLGEDQVYLYAYHPNDKKILTLKNVIKTDAGTGPRHLTFSPNGKFAYLAHEFNGRVNCFSYNDGKLVKIQEIGTTTSEFKGNIDGADIHISADGKFLYETNRGDANSITTFAVLADGRLKLVETIGTLGKGPRNFSIDPSGNFLLVAHQYTNDVVIFKRNKLTGTLIDSGKRINVGAPVCLVFSK